jgi:RNA polymerase sigma factor (sigma-70 family)
MEQTLILHPMTAESRNEYIQKTVNKEHKNLLGFIRKRVWSEADAEDILQDVFYQFVSVMQLDIIEQAASWLFKVASNKIIDWYRKRKPVSLDEINASFAINDEDTYPPLQLEDILFDPVESPDEHYLRSTIWPLLSEALDELPAEQHEVFILHELEDKSFKEIAEITGVPVNTLISRKRYAILYLREHLQELYDEYLQD